MKKWKDCVFIIAFFIFVGIFFYPSIFRQKQPIPTDTLIGLYHPFRDLYFNSNPRGVVFKNYLITDPVRQQIPWRKIAIDQLKKGLIPKWNPYNFSGTSLLANIQAGIFYPLNFLFLFFDFPLAWTILIILQPLLGGALIYLFLRNQNVEQFGSLIGSIAWSFGGFSIAWLTWGTILHVALWLPLTLLSLDKIFDQITIKDTQTRLRRSGKIIWPLIIILSLCFQFSAGHIQISLYYLLIVLTYLIWKFKGIKQMPSGAISISSKTSLNLIKVSLFAGLLGFVVLTKIIWIPLIDLLATSARISEDAWQNSGWFLPWQNLIQFFVPDFFGNPSTLNYWGTWNYGEFIGYIGILPLAVATYAFIFITKPALKFWKAILLIALVFILPTPIAKIFIYFNIPVFKVLQPTRLMMVIDFCLAILTAYGFKDFLDNKNRRSYLILKFFGLLYILFWVVVFYIIQTSTGDLKNNIIIAKRNLIFPTLILLSGSIFFICYRKSVNKISKFLFLVIFIILILFDLFRFGWKFTPFSDSKYFFPPTEAIKFLQEQQKPFRITSLDKRILPPNTNAYFGLESIEGYDPLYYADYERYFAASERGKPEIDAPFGFNRILNTQNLDTPLLQLLNLKYVLSLVDLNRADLKLVFQEGATRIYEYLKFIPRFFIVNKILIYNSLPEAYNLLYDRTFKPNDTAIVDKQIELSSLAITPDESIRLDKYTDNEIILTVFVKAKRLLIVENIYNNSWKAEIDGQAVILLKTNVILQGLVVPEGKHIVRLYYL